MKKIRANVNMNDRIIIELVDKNTIRYLFVDAHTKKEVPLGDKVPFSLSTKKYFGVHGKTVRQLYAFNDWHNKKLEIEMKRIWRSIDEQFRQKPEKHRKWEVREIYDDERAA